MRTRRVPITAIFFDAAGTLLHLRRSVGEDYSAVAAEQEVQVSPDIFENAFFKAWRSAPFRRTAGRPREDDDKNWWRDLVEIMIGEIPELPAHFDRTLFFESAYAHFAKPEVWMLYDEVLEVLQALRPKYQLNVISNFDRRLYPILRGLGLADFFEHVFLSSELGVDKPSPEIFRLAAARIGFAPEETLHVGDDPERDWEAAENAGMQVFKLNRARNSLRDLLSVLPVAAPWVGWDSNPQPTP